LATCTESASQRAARGPSAASISGLPSSGKLCDHRVTEPADHEQSVPKMPHQADVQQAPAMPRSGDLQSAVAVATGRFRAANPKSSAQHSAATAVMPGGNTRTVL